MFMVIAIVAALVGAVAVRQHSGSMEKGQAEPEREPIGQTRTAPNPLVLEISLQREAYPKDAPIQLTARFRNVGKQPVTIVRLVDGSIDGRRDPRYILHVVTAPGEPVAQRPRGGCGNCNPLYEGDVVEVPAGRTVDPFEPIDEYHFRPPPALNELYDLARPGTYRVWVEYTYMASVPLKVERCVYQRINAERTRYNQPLAKIRPLHTPVPNVPPLQVKQLKSNELVFQIIEK
jgi:hypothetical protein